MPKLKLTVEASQIAGSWSGNVLVAGHSVFWCSVPGAKNEQEALDVTESAFAYRLAAVLEVPEYQGS